MHTKVWFSPHAYDRNFQFSEWLMMAWYDHIENKLLVICALWLRSLCLCLYNGFSKLFLSFTFVFFVIIGLTPPAHVSFLCFLLVWTVYPLHHLTLRIHWNYHVSISIMFCVIEIYIYTLGILYFYIFLEILLSILLCRFGLWVNTLTYLWSLIM